jgi:hypothetical protein
VLSTTTNLKKEWESLNDMITDNIKEGILEIDWDRLVFIKKYPFRGKDGQEHIFLQNITYLSNGFNIRHAPDYEVPHIMFHLEELWKTIFNTTLSLDERKKALAEYEWWFFNAVPMGRAGASMGDAMSFIAQLICGIEIRSRYERQDFKALSTTLESYIANRIREFEDNAMKTTGPTGGIDLTSADKNLQTQHHEGEIKFYMDHAMLAKLQNAPGFVPVIINIQLLDDLRRFLGAVPPTLPSQSS